MMPDNIQHHCREMDYCICSIAALEPDEECPIHGLGPWPPRCVECGRFLPHSVREQVEPAITE